VSPPADHADPPKLHTWPRPDGGFERVMRPTARERRRQPLRRRQIIAIRLTFLLLAIFCAVVFALNVPTSSLLWREALSIAISEVLGFLWFTPRQLGQLLGLRPPAGKAP